MKPTTIRKKMAESKKAIDKYRVEINALCRKLRTIQRNREAMVEEHEYCGYQTERWSMQTSGLDDALCQLESGVYRMKNIYKQ